MGETAAKPLRHDNLREISLQEGPMLFKREQC